MKATFDGACEPRNPGGAMGLGWTIDSVGYHAFAPPNPDNTNNVAEYLALEKVLNHALADVSVATLDIWGDSQLVCCQLSGEYAVRSATLYAYWQRAQAKIRQLEGRGCKVSVTWHPRESNEQADAESKTALAENGIEPMRRVPQAGFGTLSKVGGRCGKSAVMVGRALRALGYRDERGLATQRAQDEGLASMRDNGFGSVTDWHIECTAAIVGRASAEKFAKVATAEPKPKPQRMVRIEGNTYPARKRLKELGGRWNPRLKCWMVPESVEQEARQAVAYAS